MKSRVWTLGLAALMLILAEPMAAASASRPDGIITSWRVAAVGQQIAVMDLFAQDTHDTGTGTITATFSPSAVKSVPNVTQTDNVQALVTAMKAPDWGAAASGGNYEFSSTLVAKIEAAGVNIGWVYQRLYAVVAPGMPGSSPWSPPQWVPSTPQAAYLNGKGLVSQPPTPAVAEPTPVVVQDPIMGTQTEKVPSPAKAANPAAQQPMSKARMKPATATPAQQIAQAKAQEAQNAVVAVKPSPEVPALLVNGAHTAPGWRAAQETIDWLRAAAQRTRQEELVGAALIALAGLFFLVQRMRHAWPFRRRVELW